MNSNREIYFYQSCERPDYIDSQADPKLQSIPRMLDYLDTIDPIDLKYKLTTEPLPASSRALAAEFEKRFQYSSITKQEYSCILDNLSLVYGNDGEIVEDDIKAFHKVETSLICGYFGIPQLNQMFDEDYFNFEWDMHVGQNFREHRNDYYRDHFIHQIRNLYMMLNMLEGLNFYTASEHILRDPSASKVSEFTWKKGLAFCTDELGEQQRRLMSIYSECRKAHAKAHREEHSEENLIQNPADEETIFENTPFATERAFLEAFFYKYVIYASAMLSALFHDMGYPICHFLDVRRRISEYNPTMYMFTHNAVESFDQLAFKLGSSLLFSVASPEAVRKRLEPSKKGKYDHGAYSAIAFLLQFYDTGVIYSLSAEKQCAIELAALAIYNHTSKFKIIDSKENTSYYNMYFRQNPVSFLLRFCDDLQEWDRRYFEISKSGDLLFCPNCGLPLLKHREYNEDGVLLQSSTYLCKCKRILERPDIFIKRKIYLVSVADWVKMKLEKGENKKTNLIATIHYDPYKLLMLSKTNNTYAKHRLNELYEVKMLLSDQDFSLMSNGDLAFSHIYLDYFMTANPILIKLKILERYILETRGLTGNCSFRKAHIDRDCVCAQLKKIAPNRAESTTSQQTRKRLQTGLINSALEQDRYNCSYLRNYLADTATTHGALAFYCLLLCLCLSQEDQITDELEAYLSPYRTSDPMYYEIMHSLIKDCLTQYKKSCEATDRYIEKHKEDAFYLHIKSYTDDRNYFNQYDVELMPRENNKKKYPYIGYYKDIFFFYRMNELTMRALKERAKEGNKNE